MGTFRREAMREAVTAFAAWFFAGVIFAALFSPREHGSGLFVAVGILVSGIVAGTIHAAAIILRRRKRNLRSKNN